MDKKKKNILIASVIVAALVAAYFYFRMEAQKKGWNKSKFWAGLYGVEHFTEDEADTIANEFAEQYGWNEEEWTS